MFRDNSFENTEELPSSARNFRGAASRIADTSAGPIEYFETGEGPAVLGMHGTPGGYDQVALVTDAVAARGFRVIGWSRPGYLKTPLETGRTPAEQADAAVRLLDFLKIDRICVYGASGGGPSAYTFAGTYPDRTWGLVTESAISRRFGEHLSVGQRMLMRAAVSAVTVPMLDWFADRFPETMARQIIRLEGKLDRKAARVFASQVATDPFKSAFVAGLFQTLNPLSQRRAGLLNDLAQFAQIESLPLDRITAPTLIMHGTHDSDVGFEHSEFAAQSIAGAEFIPVEGGTHLLWIAAQAEELRTRRIEFLTRHAPSE